MVNVVRKAHGVGCPLAETHTLGSCIYADIMEHIDLGIIVLDITKEEVAFQNKEAVNIFKSTTSSMDYKTISSLLLQHSEKGFISDGFGKPQNLHYNNRLLGYTAYVISDIYVGILVRDITENARLESLAEAVNIMENIRYIFSGIRHELGNPINSIKMTLSVLRQNLDTYSRDTVQNYVDRTLAEISRVEYLLKSLKSFSMFENPIIQNMNLSDFMALFQSLVAGGLERKGIKMEIMLSPEAQWICADPRVLQQVMLNIVANAVDALAGRENPTIIISTQRKSNCIWINVEDNGEGIPRDEQLNLFKPFYTTKPHGTGLGLVITKKMLSRMNSRIGIVSLEGGGATVTISIPEGRAEDA